MNQQGIDILEALLHVDPARLDYQQWCNVGMALKQEGYTADAWEQWSSRDPARFHPGECQAKWKSFRGTDTPVTAGTIVRYAMDQGWSPAGVGNEIGWEDAIGGNVRDELKVIESAWMEETDLPKPPEHMDGARQLIRYLELLFDPSDNVGYVTQSYTNEDGRHVPSKGAWDRTAGQLIAALRTCRGDLGSVLGDYSPEAGAWIRFNPLDGKGVRNENVTDFRYALVESDTLDLTRQYSLIRELQLPVAVVVHSGGKSIHAIVRIEAADYTEYRQRVDYLYAVCQKNGMQIDRQNRNPSRLSRMPGVMRAGKPQYIVAENIGLESFGAWKEYIESIHDNLPDAENLKEQLINLPPLAPELIRGILRCGHKMLLSGPSKAGKSFSLIELSIAIAEGKSWMGLSCMQGNVMYVNLELDRASCLHRFADVYHAMGIKPENADRIEVWNLRGTATPLDKLAPKLIRRCKKKNFAAVIIDPIYKVITGDENSADQMSAFCNQFDKIATELDCSVIYCHHHSKGQQGQKRSMDRASGSGVFARDPDALLDMIELEVPLQTRDELVNGAIRKLCARFLTQYSPGWSDYVSQSTLTSHVALREECANRLPEEAGKALDREIEGARRRLSARSAWRMEGILREFAPMKPVYAWFDYPVHRLDETGELKSLAAEGERRGKAFTEKATEARRENAAAGRLSRRAQLENAILLANGGDPVSVKDLCDYLDAKENTVRKWLRENGFAIDRNTGLVSEVEVIVEESEDE